MADEAGVMDTPELESPEVEVDDAELESSSELSAESTDTDDPSSTDQVSGDDPYTTRFGREYRQWLNNLKQTDPQAAKFVKQARDSYGREFALKQLEPNGIDGIRERYALLNSLTHGDAKGTDAIAAMQERLQQTDEVDGLLAAGDPRALESLGEDFNPGLAKLAPAILDRVSQSDPEAYQSAILPHVVKTLMNSPLLSEYNGKVDEINWRLSGRTLDQLSDVELKQIAQTAIAGLTGVSKNFNAMGQKAGEVKAQPVSNQRNELEQERTALDQERQKMHWDTQIEPKVQAHEKTVFDKLFDPYQKRLKLGDPQKAAAFQAFHQSIISAAQKDESFQRQYKLYKTQKNPDPIAVTGFVNHALSKYGKAAMDGLVKDRWEPFLAGRTRTQSGKPGVRPTGPVEPNVEVRSVKPPMHEIDHQNTPLDWTAMSYPGGRKYRLLTGKIVQVRSA